MAVSSAEGTAGAREGREDEIYSFRDPAGRLFLRDGRVFRVVHPEGQRILDSFLATRTAQSLLEKGQLVQSEVLSEAEAAEVTTLAPGDILVEHDKIAFPSYPYEWAPEMLHTAATMTLELARGLLPEGIGLKDGTPYNVLFRGTVPVFVDVLSFEQRDEHDPTWLPYAQFIRTFLLPLLVNKHLGMPLDQIFLTRRDGLEVEEVYRWLPWTRRIRPPFLSLVAMPTWLDARHKRDDTSIYRKKLVDDPEKARFILNALFGSLRRSLRAAAPKQDRTSGWRDYMSTNSYTDDAFRDKENFTREVLAEVSPARVLDIGCNTGHFSRLAAEKGAGVVAIDYDPVVVGSVWRSAVEEKLDILPLVVNLGRPSPAAGWRNRELSSFLDRARGQFDLLLMLAVIHHLLVSERVPLEEILRVAAEMTRDAVLMEYVDPGDPMFRVLVRGREELHRDLTPESFEAACKRHFKIVRSFAPEGATRRLYLLRKSG